MEERENGSEHCPQLSLCGVLVLGSEPKQSSVVEHSDRTDKVYCKNVHDDEINEFKT